MDNRLELINQIKTNTRTLTLITRMVTFITILNIGLTVTQCSNKVQVKQSKSSQDTTDIRVVPVDQIEGVQLSIGESLRIPSLGVDITRFSETEAVVSYPVRVDTETRTAVVSTRTKIVDKSRTVDRSKIKEVDKDKSKVVDSKGLPWWLWILLILSILIYLLWRFRKVWMKFIWPL